MDNSAKHAFQGSISVHKMMLERGKRMQQRKDDKDDCGPEVSESHIISRVFQGLYYCGNFQSAKKFYALTFSVAMR